MDDRTKLEGAPEGRPLQHSLINIRKGDLMNEAGQELANLLFACMHSGKKGRLVIELEVAPAERGSAQMTINDKLKVFMPEKDKGQSFLFAGEDGTLSREDPEKEQQGPVRQVSGDSDNVRKIGNSEE
jgi:hypothetical protein